VEVKTEQEPVFRALNWSWTGRTVAGMRRKWKTPAAQANRPSASHSRAATWWPGRPPTRTCPRVPVVWLGANGRPPRGQAARTVCAPCPRAWRWSGRPLLSRGPVEIRLRALQCARWPLGSRHVSCMCAWSVGVGLDDVNFLRIFYSAFVRTLIWTNNLSILSTSPSQWCSPNWHLRLFVIMLYFILYSLIFTCDQIYTKACGIC
jgi:hypothetical protein